MSVPLATIMLVCTSFTEQVIVVQGDAVAFGTMVYALPRSCSDVNSATALLTKARAEIAAAEAPKPTARPAATAHKKKVVKAKAKKKPKKKRRRK